MKSSKQLSVQSIEQKDQKLFKLKEDLKRFINLNAQNFSSLDEQLRALIDFGNQLTGFSFGIVANIKDEQYKIVQTVSEGDVLKKGDIFELEDTICRIIVSCEEPRIYDKIIGSEVEDVPSVKGLGLNSYIGCPIIINGELYGTLNFSKTTEIEDLETFQDSFFIIEIMAQLVGVLIAKDRQNEKVKELNLSLQHIVESLEAKNQQLEEFTYIAAHDLQEPLRNMRNMAALISRNLSNENTLVQQSIEYLTAATERMSNLVSGLMVHAQIGLHGALTEVDCNEVIKNILDDLQVQIEQSNAKIIYENLPTMLGYELETRLLFQNVIGNAIKYSRPDVPPEIQIVCEEAEDHYVFEVSDNGIGIRRENFKKIFQIFQKGQNENQADSIGIGLAHCAKIAELYQGRIWLASEFGRGTTFFIQLQKQ